MCPSSRRTLSPTCYGSKLRGVPACCFLPTGWRRHSSTPLVWRAPAGRARGKENVPISTHWKGSTAVTWARACNGACGPTLPGRTQRPLAARSRRLRSETSAHAHALGMAHFTHTHALTSANVPRSSPYTLPSSKVTTAVQHRTHSLATLCETPHPAIKRVAARAAQRQGLGLPATCSARAPARMPRRSNAAMRVCVGLRARLRDRGAAMFPSRPCPRVRFGPFDRRTIFAVRVDTPRTHARVRPSCLMAPGAWLQQQQQAVAGTRNTFRCSSFDPYAQAAPVRSTHECVCGCPLSFLSIARPLFLPYAACGPAVASTASSVTSAAAVTGTPTRSAARWGVARTRSSTCKPAVCKSFATWETD